MANVIEGYNWLFLWICSWTICEMKNGVKGGLEWCDYHCCVVFVDNAPFRRLISCWMRVGRRRRERRSVSSIEHFYQWVWGRWVRGRVLWTLTANGCRSPLRGYTIVHKVFSFDEEREVSSTMGGHPNETEVTLNLSLLPQCLTPVRRFPSPNGFWRTTWKVAPHIRLSKVSR